MVINLIRVCHSYNIFSVYFEIIIVLLFYLLINLHFWTICHYYYWYDSDILLLQHSLPRTSVSHQVKTNGPSSFSSFPYSEMSTSLWPNQDGSIGRFSPNNLGLSALSTTNIAGSHLRTISIQNDVGPPEDMVIWILFLKHVYFKIWNLC